MGLGMKGDGAFWGALEEVSEEVKRQRGWSLLEKLEAADGEWGIWEVQPLLFGMSVALASKWRSVGVEPAYVIGHSMGEVGAAYVSGQLGLAEAVRVICVRSELLRRVSGRGGMAVLELSAEETAVELKGCGNAVSLAASNGPRTTVVSGERERVEELVSRLAGRGVFGRLVKVDVASHSGQVDEILGELRGELSGIRGKAGGVKLYSTVECREVSGEELGADYWVRNLRERVRFWESVQQVRKADGGTLYVEMSPHPVLVTSLEEGIASEGWEGVSAQETLRRGEGEERHFLEQVGKAYEFGAEVDFGKVYGEGGRCVSLPTYAWEHEPYWLEGKKRRERGGHPLLGTHVELSERVGEHVWEQEISDREPSYVSEHRVEGGVVLAGACYVEMALTAGRTVSRGAAVRLEEVEFVSMLSLGEGEEVQLQTTLLEEGEGGRLKIVSRRSGEKEWREHARARVKWGAAAVFERAGERILERLNEIGSELAGEHFYERMSERGYEYAGSFRGVERVYRGFGEVISELKAAEAVGASVGEHSVHPGVLDSVFQTFAAADEQFAEGGAGELYLPTGIERVELLRPEAIKYCRARRRVTTGARRIECDLDLYDADGEWVGEVRGLSASGLGESREEQSWLYEVSWEKQAAEEARDGSGCWVVLRRGERSERVATQLRERVTRVQELAPEELRGEQAGKVLREVAELRAVVWVSELASTAEASVEQCVALMDLVQGMARAGLRDQPRLYVVSEGGQQLKAGEAVEASETSLWGLLRTVSHEHVELKATAIDVGGVEEAGWVEELLSWSSEDQVAYRQGERYVARLVRTEGLPEVVEEARELGEGSYRMEQERAGVLSELTLRRTERPSAGRGEVVVEVVATGLNFLDVLSALGVIPSGGESFGGECSGRVVEVGSAVVGLDVGDEVVCLCGAALGSHVAVREELAVKKPKSWSFEQAAGVPVAYVTAYYTLKQVGRLGQGERVLIHAAAGGVGLAAVEVSKWLGAEIYGTAGSEEKRAYLKSIGVKGALDSRSVGFSEELMRMTAGEGVDVVLNSLAGEYIDKSLSVLRDYGRFIEIGKRDYYANRSLGLRPFLRNLTFSLVDLKGLTDAKPRLVGELLKEVIGLLEGGALKLPQVSVYEVEQAQEAFYQMAQGKHRGKLVIRHGELSKVRVKPRRRAVTISERGTYLITGGLGGLGLEIAEELIEQGARQLVLVSRRQGEGAAAERLRALRERGAQVEVMQADVSDAAQVKAVLKRIRQELPELRGVVHAAGVLSDALLIHLNREQFKRVALPKVHAGRALDEALGKLDFFVAFSSGASVLGAPGQSNYAAANAYLDGLMAARHSRGQAGLAIQWGPWSQVGLAAAQENRGQRIARRGLASLTPEQGRRLFVKLLSFPRSQVAVLPLNLRQWVQSNPMAAGTPFLSSLVQAPPAVSSSAHAGIRGSIARARGAQLPELLQKHLIELVAKILRIESSRIGSSTELPLLGFDSLLALELRNRLEADLGVKLSATLLWAYPTVARLVPYLVGKLEAVPGDEGVKSTEVAPLSQVATPQTGSGAEPSSQLDFAAAIGALANASTDDLVAALKKRSRR
jgi:acyl transferase domain-containing protein/acyl carrier protein